MRRTMIGIAALLALAFSASPPAHAATHFGFRTGIENAPPPPQPFRVVDVKEVPVQGFDVPPEKWHHHPLGGPPGQMKRR